MLEGLRATGLTAEVAREMAVARDALRAGRAGLDARAIAALADDVRDELDEHGEIAAAMAGASLDEGPDEDAALLAELDALTADGELALPEAPTAAVAVAAPPVAPSVPRAAGHAGLEPRIPA